MGGSAIQHDVFVSKLVYEPTRIHAAAVYCSDGRVGEHFDDFLMNGLRLPRYDRVALPGGPACLTGHVIASVERESAVRELRFLAEVHGLERVVLIAHEGCAFYAARLRLSGPRMEARQRDDLQVSAECIRKAVGIQHVEAYFARRDAYQIVFEPVELT